MKRENIMRAKQRVCRECGGKANVVRKDYRFIESGLNNVFLKDIEVVVCSGCKAESPRIPNHDDLMRTIAVALVDKPYELAGDEVRFLRKYLGEGSVSFAKMLGIDRSHLSRVENGAMAISRQTDRLVRTLALVHDPTLVQKLKRLGRHEEVLRRLSEIGSDMNPIEMQLDHAKDGYTYDLKAAA
jgi:DNA-binding transcriptional regulator YiaG